MNHPPSFKIWENRQRPFVRLRQFFRHRLFARLRLFFRRAAAWLWNYFALNHPLDWPPAARHSGPNTGWRGPYQQPARREPAAGIPPGGNTRTGISHFYLGILAGCFIMYFFLGGEMTAKGPLTAADYQSIAGIALALLLYPAIHRLGRFDDLRTISGSLLVSAMFGFIIPLLVRLLGG